MLGVSLDWRLNSDLITSHLITISRDVSAIAIVETKVKIFQPLNTVGKSSFFNVAGLLDPTTSLCSM